LLAVVFITVSGSTAASAVVTGAPPVTFVFNAAPVWGARRHARSARAPRDRMQDLQSGDARAGEIAVSSTKRLFRRSLECGVYNSETTEKMLPP
jgi:hypothetical protein